MKQLVLTIDGMMCGHCESHVNDVVRRAAKVEKVTSSHVDGRCEIVLDDDIPSEPIVAAIEGDGYKVLDVKEEPYEKRSFFKKLLKK